MQRNRFLRRMACTTTLFALVFGFTMESSAAAPWATRTPANHQRVSRSRAPVWFNQSQMVITSQGVMHRAAAARLGLRGTPLPSGGTGGGTQDPGIRR